MIDIRAISTLGIGVSIAAISAIGFVSETTTTTEPYSLIGGGASLSTYPKHVEKPKIKKKKTVYKFAEKQLESVKQRRTEIDLSLFDENEEEEAIVAMVLTELFRRDLI